MQNYVALLRGINVSGKNIIKMDQLKACCLGLGWQKVKTYIQSGNVVFQAADLSTTALAEQLEAAIESTFGLQVPVLVKTQQDWERCVADNPYLAADTETNQKQLYLSFLYEFPDSTVVEALLAKDYGGDHFQILGNRVYFYYENGYGRSKLNNSTLEKQLKVAATTRNWRTTLKLLALLEAL